LPLLAAVALVGCAPAASPFLSDCPSLHRAEVQKRFGTETKLDARHFQRVFIEPIDVSRVANEAQQAQVRDALTQNLVVALQSTDGWGWTSIPQEATVFLQVSVTRFAPGSRAGRILAPGVAGIAYIDVEGKWIDPESKRPLACFADGSTSSGFLGLQDLPRNASGRMVNGIAGKLARRMLAQVEQERRVADARRR
jgi:hypothetical protein